MIVSSKNILQLSSVFKPSSTNLPSWPPLAISNGWDTCNGSRKRAIFFRTIKHSYKAVVFSFFPLFCLPFSSPRFHFLSFLSSLVSFAFSVPWMAINVALLGKIGSSRDNQGALAVAAQQRSPKYRASLKELSQFAWTGGWIMSFYMWPLFILLVIYRDRLIHGPQVWWSLLLLLLTTSASTCLKNSWNLGNIF